MWDAAGSNGEIKVGKRSGESVHQVFYFFAGMGVKGDEML